MDGDYGQPGAEVHHFMVGEGVRMQRSFPVSNAGLTAASGFLSTCIRELGLGEAIGHRVSVILDEVCANMIRHDASLHPGLEFSLEVEATASGACLTISDPGQPFNPLAFRHKEQPEIGGRGITLIKGLASAVSYERADHRNHLTITVRDN